MSYHASAVYVGPITEKFLDNLYMAPSTRPQ